jgi:putative DNA primase/helicase
LEGARLAHVAEILPGQPIDILAKSLSQGRGSKFKATRKFRNSREFWETWTVWLDMNDDPSPILLHPYDQAMLARLHLIPFPKSFTNSKDVELYRKLVSEWDGILQWRIAGYRLYKKHGLVKPAASLQALAALQEASDNTVAFTNDRCRFGKGLLASATELFQAYCEWCTHSRERASGSGNSRRTW